MSWFKLIISIANENRSKMLVEPFIRFDQFLLSPWLAIGQPGNDNKQKKRDQVGPTLPFIVTTILIKRLRQLIQEINLRVRLQNLKTVLMICQPLSGWSTTEVRQHMRTLNLIPNHSASCHAMNIVPSFTFESCVRRTCWAFRHKQPQCHGCFLRHKINLTP